ncbi:MAG: DedA family protein [Parcubacteria group bacterium]
MSPDYLILYLSGLHYLGLFIILAFVGFLIPFPEEIVLLAIGYLAAIGNNVIWYVLAVALLGVFCGDCLIFFLAGHGSRLINFMTGRLAPKKMAKYEALFHKNAPHAIMAMRFIPGLRIISPIMAAAHHVKWQVFIISDIIALFIYVPLYTFIGYFFHQNLALIFSRVMIMRHYVFVATLMVVLIGICLFVRKRFSNNK